MIRFAGPRSGDLGMANLLFEFNNFPQEREIVGTLLIAYGEIEWGLTVCLWPAPGSEDTELGVLMEREVGHGEAEVYTRVQA